MRKVTTVILDSEWRGFKAWCREQGIIYSVVYQYDDSVIIKIPVWYLIRWMEGE